MHEYAYGPAQGLRDTKVGAFTQALYDEAKSKGWPVHEPQASAWPADDARQHAVQK